jgi:Bacterial extracellular solute-binding protein
MQRRTFLKLTGIAGILVAHRAPAFAQGTKLHIVRWVDFIPEADVELKRQAPEASKALGAEVTFEFINANDLQPRITAAIQSGSGADIIQMLWNWPHLYASALVDVSDVADAIAKGQGGFYDIFTARSAPRSFLRHGTSTVRSARSSRPRASRSARRWGTASAIRPPSPTRSYGTSAAPRSTRAARRSCSTARAPSRP